MQRVDTWTLQKAGEAGSFELAALMCIPCHPANRWPAGSLRAAQAAQRRVCDDLEGGGSGPGERGRLPRERIYGYITADSSPCTAET